MALRLMELDSSIYYTFEQKEAGQKDNGTENFIKLPSRYSTVGGLMDNASQARYLQQDNLTDLGSGHSSLKRGRGRPRGPSRSCSGKKSQLKAIGSQNENHPRGRGGRKKGRRSVRSRRKAPAEGLGKNVVEKRCATTDGSPFDDTVAGLHQEVRDLKELPIEAEVAEYVGSSGRSESEDDNVQASGDEFDDDLFVDDSSNKFRSVDYGVGREDDEQHVEDGDDIVKYDDDDDDDNNDVDEAGDYYVDGYFNSEDYNEERNQSPASEEQVRNADRSPDRGSVSSSSDYSY